MFSTETRILVQIYPGIFSLRCIGRSKQAHFGLVCRDEHAHVCMATRVRTYEHPANGKEEWKCSCKHGGGIVEGDGISKPALCF